MARSEQGPVSSKQTELVCANNKTIDVSYDRVTKFLEENKRFYKETDPYQDEVTYNASSDNPMTFVGMGDSHLGALSGNQKEFKKHMDLIKDTPNVVAFSLSNLIDGFIPSHHIGGKQDSPLPLLKEALAINDLLKGMGNQKMLGMVHSPCHEGWAETYAGIDPQQLMAMDTGIPLLENGSVVNVKFPNGKKFSVGLWHQPGRGGEAKNAASWGHQSKSRIGTMDAIMIGHSHVAEAEHSMFGEHPNRNDVAFLRTGSYKGNVANEDDTIADRFQRGHSGRDGELGGQAVTYYPRTGHMKVHRNLLQAVQHQENLNRFAVLESTGKLHDIWEAVKTIESRI